MCKIELPWYLDDNVSGIHEGNTENYQNFSAPGANYNGLQYGFYHTALSIDGIRSQFSDRVMPLLYSLEEKTNITVNEIYRIRIALTTSVNEEVQHHPHVDLRQPHKVLLYYVNDSDGDTFMFNEFYSPDEEITNFTIKEKVTPKKNRAVVFDGLRYHNSSKPVKNSSRFIINIDFN